MNNLRKKVIRLAYHNPGPVRDALLPLLKKGGQEYAYGMQFRPLSGATVPKGYIDHKSHPDFKYGVIVYPRKLSDADVHSFELVYVPSPREEIAILKGISRKLDSDWVEDYEDDPRWAAQGVGSLLEQAGVYIDRDKATALIFKMLKR